MKSFGIVPIGVGDLGAESGQSIAICLAGLLALLAGTTAILKPVGKKHRWREDRKHGHAGMNQDGH